MIRVRSAFTLVEMLVVIAIIIVMVAFLLPVLNRAREKSRQVSCISNQRQLSLALSMAVQDNQEVFPGKMGVDDGTLWQKEVQPFVDSARSWRCPSSTGEKDESDYGLNFYLYGLQRGGLTDTSRLIMLADANSLLIRAQDDVAARRHAGSYIATFADNHSETITDGSKKVIFASGDEGTILCYYPEFTPISFSSSRDAKGMSSSMMEGGVVLLTNETQGALAPWVIVSGGDRYPAKGFIPGVSQLQLAPGHSRAFALYCRSLSSNDMKVQTNYTFGAYPNTVVIYVNPPAITGGAYRGY